VSPPPASSFSFEPLFLVLCVAAAVVYGLGARRERPPWRRVVLFGFGLLLVVGALNSPLETIAVHYLLLIHLLQNVMIADWAPPLLILGLTPAMRAAIAQRGGAALAWVTRPKVALPVWLVGWYGIHLAVFYDFALRNPWALNIEHALLIAIGLVFWWPVFAEEPHAVSAPVKVGYLGAAFVGSAFLGLGLTFSDAPFYDFYEAAPRLWGLSPAQDQNFGGVLMNAEQAAVFLAAILYFLVRLIPEDERTSSRA
jgi:cytochrome c oxidase assembly factor CtaG